MRVDYLTDYNKEEKKRRRLKRKFFLQNELANKYDIPVGTIRFWIQSNRLRVIGRNNIYKRGSYLIREKDFLKIKDLDFRK